MTALNKRALRKAAMHAKMEDDWGCDADNFHDKATPDAVLALLDELEAAEKRIAELEARKGEQLLRSLTLVLKQYDDYGQISLEAIEEAEFEIKTAIAAGIGVKGE
ncbi:ead/Ea22-like family protein [Citrobacter freundii]|uniref:ead/Ea22-like family protein n=1 Tax=Citrobacter freundii TaxID=546 RepID=UPI00195965BE|nr:ead/Ea22-like family protein [Citrobacter freundii]MBM7307020.1 ead/Ea22-like family protein [Citrobacter freundii]MBN4038144.1 ead/Ea22-like family protein [Citrobacter freundii]